MASKIALDKEEIPKQWYSILPDLPKPLPPIVEPAKKAPGPGIVPLIFPKEIIAQEFSKDRWVEIPEEVREVYRIWRPTPLYRAVGLEKALKTPAKIYYKYEGTSPSGSHKPNTAVAQAYYNMKEGKERIATETGAGQWGSALAFGCMTFKLDCTVYMVRVSYDQKPYRRVMMELWDATVHPSPSTKTEAGRKILKEEPESTGSLGIAISEAVEDALTHKEANYGIGSVFNHVLLHQTVVGLEAKKQLEKVEDYPDVIVGCIGGGSSFSGLFWPFYYDKVMKKAPKETDFVAVEATACPSVTKGQYMYDHGDTARHRQPHQRRCSLTLRQARYRPRHQRLYPHLSYLPVVSSADCRLWSHSSIRPRNPPRLPNGLAFHLRRNDRARLRNLRPTPLPTPASGANAG